MILDKKLLVVVSGKNKPWYESKGYSLPYSKDSRGRIRVKRGSTMVVDFEDIHPFSQIKIKYKCDMCGKIMESHFQSIVGRRNSQYNKDGRTFCSSCANKNMSGIKSGAYKHGSKRFPEYRNNAKRRGIDFSLSVEEFEDLINKPCHYCGGYSSDRFENSRGNGIDRKDSSKGYIKYNCVPCCSTCNFVKNKMSYKNFILYIRDLYERTKNYEV